LLTAREGKRKEQVKPNKRRFTVARKALLLLLPASVAVAVASQWREINRYLKVAQMSSGDGHPQNVPASGAPAYKHPGAGDSDGTGQFDSASRGGGPVA
jgi:hypothetical protein